MTHPHLPHRALGAAAAVVCAVLLTGCGGSAGDTGTASGTQSGQRSGEQDVASVATGTPSASPSSPSGAPAAGSEQGRPQLRLDSSDAERDRYWNAYATCLKDHGHKMILARGPYSIDQNDNSPTAKAAQKTCAGKLPLQPPELRRDSNPHYDDDYRAYIKCLNSRGLKVVALPDNSGWTFDGQSTMSDTEQTKVDKNCTMEAFGGKNR
ncbi:MULTISPECIES: hypothetical protein [unclassified Streptomyces]|uniref:hypothetical protein n=1 Tax=unclassified Streptomyces TaxID=2593676 RepID=UPI00036B1F37|nr:MULTISPECIES: hypothetical protein [unclassified Streptomyces]MYX37127.1 hypothetical protein [Streptomyces sp. SID8377]